MGWTVLFQSASYDGILTTSESDLQSDLNMLLSTGASCIRIDMGYDAWLSNNVTAIKEMAGFVNQIKAAGKCLDIADASAEIYRTQPIAWTQFKEAWVERDTTLASFYQPNFFEVVKEPGWYYPMISDYPSNLLIYSSTDWSNLTNWLANSVHSVSPTTKVGIATPGSTLSYVNIAEYIANVTEKFPASEIAFVGFDIYGEADLSDTSGFLSLMSNYGGMSGKSIWIAETWPDACTSVPMGQTCPSSSEESLDILYLQVIYYYGLYIHATNIMPFYTNAFVSYSAPTDLSQRTTVFYTFQHLATIYGGPVS